MDGRCGVVRQRGANRWRHGPEDDQDTEQEEEPKGGGHRPHFRRNHLPAAPGCFWVLAAVLLPYTKGSRMGGSQPGVHLLLRPFYRCVSPRWTNIPVRSRQIGQTWPREGPTARVGTARRIMSPFSDSPESRADRSPADLQRLHCPYCRRRLDLGKTRRMPPGPAAVALG